MTKPSEKIKNIFKFLGYVVLCVFVLPPYALATHLTKNEPKRKPLLADGNPKNELGVLLQFLWLLFLGFVGQSIYKLFI